MITNSSQLKKNNNVFQDFVYFTDLSKYFYLDIDKCAMDKKRAVEETCSKCLKYEELYANELLEREKANTKLYDKILVQQEYKRFLKYTKKKNIEISEGL